MVSYGEKQGEQELREALSGYSYSVRGVVSTADSIVIGAGTQPAFVCFVRAAAPGQRDRHRGTGLSPSGAGVSGLWLSAPPSRRRPGGNQHEGIRGFQSQRAVRQPLQSDEGQGRHSYEPQVRNSELGATERTGWLLRTIITASFGTAPSLIPALQSLSGGKRVAYLGSFSKLLLPSVQNRLSGDAGGIGYPYWDKVRRVQPDRLKDRTVSPGAVYPGGQVWNGSCDG